MARIGSCFLVVCCLFRGVVAAEPAVEAVRQASAAYVEAYNARDFAALGGQWTEKAQLIEGSARVAGREKIVGSIRGWLERHPQAKLAIDVTDVEMLATSLARVSGVMRFTREPGAKPESTRFQSLRVLDDGAWRLSESLVIPSHAAALDDLDWLVGTWRSTEAGKGRSELVFTRPLGAYCLVGRGTLTPADGPAVETMHVVHADRDTGIVRIWAFDSSGAMAEGRCEFDGTSFNLLLAGTPGEKVPGRQARWTQVIAPAGEGKFTMHAIERSIDGVPLPDGQPVHFQKAP